MSIYLINVKNNDFVNILVRRKAHLIDNLETNMLIDNDVTMSKNVIFDLNKKLILNDNCETSIAFDVNS